MDALLFFQTLWFVIIGVALLVFTILDGFDLGVGMLLPFGFSKPEHKVRALGSIWPVWDGNELWGLAAAGALFAVFPTVFSLILTAFYPFVIILLVALMYRPVAFEIWFHNVKSRAFWQGVFAVCSATIVLLIGVILGNTMVGLGLATAPRGTVVHAGGLLDLLNPFSILTGLVLVAACLVHGASWLLVKLDGQAQVEARSALNRSWVGLLGLSLLWFFLGLMLIPGIASRPMVYITAALLVITLVFLRVLAGGRGEKRIFLVSTLALGFFWATVAAIQFPLLVRDSLGTGLSVTIQNAGAELSTISFLGIVSPIILVVVAGYSVFVYRVFKGKAQGTEY